MRAVVQRTKGSSVTVNNAIIAKIDIGLTVFLGVKKGDQDADLLYIIDKIVGLRIFPDEEGKMNKSLQDIEGEVLLVSQFTLYGDVRKGRRPSFTVAESPALADELIRKAKDLLLEKGIKVQSGIFGADMQINIINDGPCTILLDSDRIL